MNTLPTKQPGTSILNVLVPIEKFSLIRPSTGSNGVNRHADTSFYQIKASTDLEAVESWIASHKQSKQTYRNYRKEIERLMLWAHFHQQKSLSDLMLDDMQEYADFLSEIPKEWCQPKLTPRHSFSWRPFRKSLSRRSRQQALMIIKSFFSYMVGVYVWRSNPMKLMKNTITKLGAERYDNIDRALTQEQWGEALEFVESLPHTTKRECAEYERTLFLFKFLYLLGPRGSELVTNTMGTFYERSRGQWWWKFAGKGGKKEPVPVTTEMICALARYRKANDLSPYPLPDEKTPLMLGTRRDSNGNIRGIGYGMIYKIIAGTMEKLALSVEAHDAATAMTYRRVSTHWFRHTSASHQIRSGVAIKHVQDTLRHSTIETTTLYIHSEKDQWHDDMEKHRTDNYKKSQ